MGTNKTKQSSEQIKHSKQPRTIRHTKQHTNQNEKTQ